MHQPGIAARLDRLPITRTHIAAVVIVGIGTFFDLFDVFLAGVLGTVLTRRFHLSELALPAVLGSSFLGMFFGSVCLGVLADRIGRRTAYLLNLGIYSAFTLMGAFSFNAPTLIITRFFAGLGIGAELPLGDAYLSELLPAHRRGRFIAWAYTFGFFGVPAVGFLARFLVARSPLGIDGWRWLFVAGSLGAAIVWALRGLLPESPRWLESVGRAEEAAVITERIECEGLATYGALAAPLEVAADRPQAASLRTLLTGQYRGRMAMLAVFQTLQTVGYYGFGTIVPLVLAAKGFSVVTSLTYSAVAFIGYPIGAIVSVPFVERIDRRWLIVCSASLMGMFGLALGYSTAPAALVSFGFLYTVVSNFFSNAFHIFQAEIFPTGVRATATGSAYGLSRLSGAAMPFVLLPVLHHSGPTVMFAVSASAMLFVVLDIALFAPATTGRTLEEINALPPHSEIMARDG